jgi:hypothetical protein
MLHFRIVQTPELREMFLKGQTEVVSVVFSQLMREEIRKAIARFRMMREIQSSNHSKLSLRLVTFRILVDATPLLNV